MTHRQNPSIDALRDLSAMALFHGAYLLTTGDSLQEAVAKIKRYYSPTDWASEIWKLGRDGRMLIERYAEFVRRVGQTTGSDHPLDEEFSQIENMIDAITSVCDELGIEELRDSLQRDLTTKAERGAFRHDETVYLEVSIQSPSMILWDHLELKKAIESMVLPKLKWSLGFVPRRFIVVEVRQSDLQARVTVTVRVGEKIQG